MSTCNTGLMLNIQVGEEDMVATMYRGAKLGTMGPEEVLLGTPQVVGKVFQEPQRSHL